MKSFLLLAVTTLSGMFLNAQTVSYQPLHGNYTQYLNRYQYWDGTQNVESFSKTIWSGDTTIGGQNYVRIFQNGNYVGGIREDVPNQQRFFIDPNDVETNITISHFLTAGTILTDSSKYMGAFRTYFGYFDGIYDTLYVDQVVPVLEDDGTYSATYHLRRLPQPNTFVFNTYRGLLNYQKLEFALDQVCYREDGEQTPPGQQTPWTFMCDLGLADESLLEIGISPNPSVDFVELSGKDLHLINELTVYDLNGTLVKNVEQSEISTRISLAELESGMYFLTFNGNAKTVRLIKH